MLVADDRNLARLAEDGLARLGDHDALIFEGQTFRSGELHERARRVAGGLVDLGVALGERVVVFMANCPEVLISYNAIWRAGAVVTRDVPSRTLVVGSPHRRSRIGRAVLGSVAEHVLHNAPCDVVVAPRGYAERRHDRLRQVAAAFDGMPESWLALRRAQDLALQAGTTLEILVAEDPVVSSVEAQKEGKPPARQDVMSEALASVRPSLSAHGKKLEPGRRKVAPTIAASIAEACRSDADILVCGSRLPMERAFAGSVTKHLIAESPCPVLVIPHAG